MDYILLINGIYGGCNPFTDHLRTSWDIQVCLFVDATYGNNQFEGEITPHFEAIYNDRFKAHLVEFVHARHSIYGSFFKVTF